MYGRNIQLTYQGKDKFTTKFGALCTFLVAISVILYAVLKAQQMINPEYIMHYETKIPLSNLYEIYEDSTVI